MKKRAFVTGGNSGIGFATARLLKKRGYDVIISGRNYERLQKAADDLGVESVQADISDLDALADMTAPFLEGDGLDVLVNNAAIASFKPLTAHTEDDYKLFFDTNIRGPLELIRLLLPALEKRQGSICNVSSVIVSKGVVNASLYAACKGAMDAFTRSLAREFAPKKVRINAVAPGAIETPMFEKLGFSEEELHVLRCQQEANIPLNRYGRSEEVAAVIVSQLEATYVTGAIWTVDGGVGV
ncbi:MAG: SDR family oxidoreductase [Desulfobulbaceae bacterium]|nr:SDR family oxidoreductase [Desulfobulbaceae bacterium]